MPPCCSHKDKVSNLLHLASESGAGGVAVVCGAVLLTPQDVSARVAAALTQLAGECRVLLGDDSTPVDGMRAVLAHLALPVRLIAAALDVLTAQARHQEEKQAALTVEAVVLMKAAATRLAGPTGMFTREELLRIMAGEHGGGGGGGGRHAHPVNDDDGYTALVHRMFDFVDTNKTGKVSPSQVGVGVGVGCRLWWWVWVRVVVVGVWVCGCVGVWVWVWVCGCG